jgi:hypothetical protein
LGVIGEMPFAPKRVTLNKRAKPGLVTNQRAKRVPIAALQPMAF